MHFLCRSFIGRDPSFWSRFWENEPDDLNVRQAKGHLFSLISISGTTSEDLSAVGRSLIDDITTAYFSPDYPTPPEAFESITQTLSAPDIKSLSPTLVIMAQVKDRIFIYLFGDTSVYLYRQLKMSCLLSSTSGLPATIQGQIVAGDVFLFGHNTFFNQYGPDSLRRPLPATPAALEDLFLSALMGFTHQNTAAALVSTLPDDEIIVSPPPVLPPSRPLVDSPRPRKFSLFRPRPVFVTPSTSAYTRRHSSLNLLLSLIVILAVGLLVGLGYRRNRQLGQTRQSQKLISQIESNLTQAINVKNLDPDAALMLTQKAKTQLVELLKIDPGSSKAESLSKQVDELAGRIGSGADFNPPLFYDGSLLSSKPNYQKLLLVGDQMALIDSASGRVDLINLTLRSKTNFYQNSDLSTYLYYWVSGTRILAGSSTQINSVEPVKKTLYSFPDSAAYTSAASWNESSYLIGPNLTDIYKFTPQTKDTFSPPKPWLVSSKLDFSPVSVAINGKVYLLGSDCRVRLFDRGKAATFISVPITTCRSPASLSVDTAGSRLAFLDNSESVYLLDSAGQIKSRFVFSNKKFLDVLLHPTLPKIYFLASDQKIYYLDL